MTNSGHEHYPDTHHSNYSKTLFGFWIYLLTDFVMFATFFATYAVYCAGAPTATLFNLPIVFIQTLLLLGASFTSGLGGVFAMRKNKQKVVLLFGITFLCGLCFLGLETFECARLITNGNAWGKNAFLSAFYTLIGMHALHLVFGLLWIVVLLIPVFLNGLTPTNTRRLICLRMFWQFLNIVWIFIFTLVYLMGVI